MQRQEKYAQISLHYFLEVPFLQESGYSLVVACLCDHTVPTLYSAGVMNMHDQTCFPLLLLFVHVFSPIDDGISTQSWMFEKQAHL